ncbi:prepilin-type N-terminal cleavage/methylation domain-containing protein, partial [Candidatus Roizmanbacteria bacterium]|nr:prepilin-type N-terminal cleavage/methylation domain-containing protein [Candidatus Roizmanbacteria bacterium]
MKKKGFTIIETVVVLTIISVISGLSLASYNSFQQQKKVQQQSTQVVDVLELAKAKSLASDLSGPGACDIDDFEGYQVNISSTTSYTLERCCDGACANVQLYRLPSGLTFNDVGKQILFQPLTGGTAGTTVAVKNASNTCAPIGISSTGVIDEQPLTSC